MLSLGSFLYSLRLKEHSTGMLLGMEFRGKIPVDMFTDGVDAVESELARGGARDEREETWLDERLVVVLDLAVGTAPLVTVFESNSG